MPVVVVDVVVVFVAVVSRIVNQETLSPFLSERTKSSPAPPNHCTAVDKAGRREELKT
jgi:hypothetical protein